jgi:hypothetical protein
MLSVYCPSFCHLCAAAAPLIAHSTCQSDPNDAAWCTKACRIGILCQHSVHVQFCCIQYCSCLQLVINSATHHSGQVHSVTTLCLFSIMVMRVKSSKPPGSILEAAHHEIFWEHTTILPTPSALQPPKLPVSALNSNRNRALGPTTKQQNTV